jgi:hypothetical protein
MPLPLDDVGPQVQIIGDMKINRLMQVVFVSGAVTVAVPAFATSPVSPEAPSALCGGDSDEDEDEDESEEGAVRPPVAQSPVALCGEESDEDDDEDEDGEETSLL